MHHKKELTFHAKGIFFLNELYFMDEINLQVIFLK
jgi:hypothetical protein